MLLFCPVVVESVRQRCSAANIFAVANRKNNGQDVLYQSVRLSNGVVCLIELTLLPQTNSVQVCPSVHPCLSVCLCLSVCICVCPYLSVYFCVCPSVCVYLSVSVCFCLSVSVCVCPCMSVLCLSVCTVYLNYQLYN